MRPRVLVTGARGQLGNALRQSCPDAFEWLEARARLDITVADKLTELVRALRPQLIINAAAYTHVDRAESEVELAHRVNGLGPSLLAGAALDVGAQLVHVSTDFVFDGRKSTPYLPHDLAHPLNVYGQSKLAGEAGVREKLGDTALIVRTAWVYSPTAPNFVHTMRRLMRERSELKVVSDQIGTPTHAIGLAEALWRLHREGVTGTHHWTDAGVASWYDFAQAIHEYSARHAPETAWCKPLPIRSEDFPTPAVRPRYSVLDKTSSWAVTGVPPHWRERLDASIRDFR